MDNLKFTESVKEVLRISIWVPPLTYPNNNKHHKKYRSHYRPPSNQSTNCRPTKRHPRYMARSIKRHRRTNNLYFRHQHDINMYIWAVLYWIYTFWTKLVDYLLTNIICCYQSQRFKCDFFHFINAYIFIIINTVQK